MMLTNEKRMNDLLSKLSPHEQEFAVDLMESFVLMQEKKRTPSAMRPSEPDIEIQEDENLNS